MKVLVLGESGQLGSELRRASWPAGVQLFAPKLEELDIADAPALRDALDRISPELVVNAAAYTAVDKAESERELAFRVNADAPGQLAHACHERGIPFFHVSTDYVFDGKKPTPYLESDPTGPLNCYGQSKLAGEERVRAAATRHVILRTSWVFSAIGANFVKTIRRLARERDALRVVDDQHGRPTSARALARALVHLGARYAAEGALPYGTYHFACRGATSWYGFASEILAQTSRARVAQVTAIGTVDYPTPAARPQNSVLDTSLFEHAFDFRLPSWQEELRAVSAELEDAEQGTR